jgi:filamentous hemagglutinin family protein
MRLLLTRLGWILLLGGLPGAAWAQVTPDGTLSTTVTSTDGRNFTIENGDRAGSSLFHSFRDFSVPTGGSAVFNNASDIQNIFSRVTGSSLSNIDGLIRANGNANLFLLNPNGIVFGANARLEIGGSFIGSTANRLRFADGTEFETKNPSTVLTVSVPVGLQYGSQGSVVTLGNLAVNPGQTLGLIGSTVSVNGGSLSAAAGQVELGAVQSGEVSITGLNFDYGNVPHFGNIAVLNQATVDTSGTGGGGIQVMGRGVTIAGGANLQANALGDRSGNGIAIQAERLAIGRGSFVASNSLGAGTAGNITLRASQRITLTGVGVLSFQQQLLSLLAGNGKLGEQNLPTGSLLSLATSTGSSGEIQVQSPRVNLREGALILTTTFGQGNGGNVRINAPNRIVLQGSGLISGSALAGAAGDISIDARRVAVLNGAVLSSATLGAGAGGDIQIRAADAVVAGTATGFLGESLAASVIAANSVGGNAPAGDITIDVERLRVAGGGVISAGSGIFADQGRLINLKGGIGGDMTIRAAESMEVMGRSPDDRFPSVVEARTVSPSAAGDVRIITRRLVVGNGALITSDTSYSGQGGDVFVQANDIELFGRTDPEFHSGLFASSGVPGRNLVATGAAGDINLTTENLRVDRNAQIGVYSLGRADAGGVRIQANRIAADNGRISATTASGEGGNVRLWATDSLFLQNGSQITATAGGSGDGGNMTLNSPFIIATNNSDIIANAVRGQGGNIQITTEGMFGTEFRPQLTPSSDITASSQFGVSGQVTISRPSVDPNSGLIALPENVVDSSQQIAATCDAVRDSRFVVTGRSGIPQDPTALVNGDRTWNDLRDLSIDPPRVDASLVPDSSFAEATGWTTNEQGKISLITINEPETTSISGTCAQSANTYYH